MPPDRLPSEMPAVPAKVTNRHECRPDPRRNNVADMSPSTALTTIATLLITQMMSETAKRLQHANAVLTLRQILPFTPTLPITVAPPLPATASSSPLHSSTRHYNHVQTRSFHPQSPNIRPCNPNTACPRRRGRNTVRLPQCGFLLLPHRNSTILPLSRSPPCREVREAAQGVRI
jgi:hypothetical protein